MKNVTGLVSSIGLFFQWLLLFWGGDFLAYWLMADDPPPQGSLHQKAKTEPQALYLR